MSAAFGRSLPVTPQHQTRRHVQVTKRVSPTQSENVSASASFGGQTSVDAQGQGHVCTQGEACVHAQAQAHAQVPVSFNEQVYALVSRIPQGFVATYGQIAALAGRPRNARMVGYALHANPQPGIIPCHRVVFRDGSLAPGFAFGGPDRQRVLLEEEGVVFIPGQAGREHAGDAGWVVDLMRCQWRV